MRRQQYSTAPVIAFWDRLTCTVNEATAVSGLTRSKLFELIASGRLQSVKVDRRRLVCVPSLRELTTPKTKAAGAAGLAEANVRGPRLLRA